MVAEEVLSILKKDFDLPVETKVADEDSLFRLLVPIVHRMLDREFERLLQICYRIDIGEEKLKKILHESPPENMAEELTRAMIDRQVQKIEIRKKYSK
ncbi:MAG: hypothetical protein EA341_10080 [Mongoliibacter sp.]|uniref:hypothetical protein n=1 Tax=Mongoliibacter sp. TaxID=2022438 RepID=UPI0012F3488F|nr:hypothetical protein [Mongoliibacter sp.]TVP49015.1 MAG: hypothetical protein EA341_10080 [Mongoliibacter sp.]